MIAQAIHDHDPDESTDAGKSEHMIMRTIENIDHCGWDNLLQDITDERIESAGR